jgi:fucose 4-O-acetylase-like acetyltransferase
MSPLQVYICGLSGTLGIIFLAKYLKDLPFFSYWGRYSIMILLTHGLLLQVYIPIIKKIPVSDTLLEIILLVITMFSYNILIPIMKKYLPYVTAQKDVIKV